MHVLVIDDEVAIRQILSATVARAGHTVDTASGVKEAAAKLVRGDVDLALCDIRMEDGDGVELVRSLRGSGIDTQFIMVTAFASVETAVEALRAGASDYMVKPIRSEELLHRLAQAESMRGLREENRVLKKLVSADGQGGRFSFESEKMLQLDRLIAKVAKTDSTILVTGESGTGKGVVSRAIHEQSLRADAPFLPVNCGAIPENLIESELFGHTKGAFSGADKARKGLFLAADHGTIFLDEIGELPLPMQAKLLHVIEDKAVRPIGAEQSQRVNVRVIAATNRDLAEMVKQGRFREDLYFRVSQFHIHIPPLREHKEDIPRLMRYLMGKIPGARMQDLEIDPVVEEALTGYAWPGNVREMENVINRAFIMADGGRVTIADLPPDITRAMPEDAAFDAQIPADLSDQGLREQLRKVEADIIFRTINACNGDRKAAARSLRVGLSSLYRKLDEFASMGWRIE